MEPTKNFVCEDCGVSFAMTLREIQEAGDEPRCPECGSKDSVQLEEPKRADRQTGFVVKDSGKRQDFTTGARRDTQDGKGDFSRFPFGWLWELAKAMQARNEPMDRLDLVPVEPLLRLAAVYGRGGTKYDAAPTRENPDPLGNWRKGIPLSRTISSLQRHVMLWALGDETEDHLAQAVWNCFTLMWTQEEVRAGRLPAELGDFGPIVSVFNCEAAVDTVLSDDLGRELRPLRKGHVLFRMPGGPGRPDQTPVAISTKGAVLRGWVPTAALNFF